MSIKTICIVGAGFGGLSAARVFKAMGYDTTVYEKEADVGGVWSASRRYPGLTTQNPRSTYALSDYPMPSDYPEWPSGEQVQAYMHAYAVHFGFLDRIHLNAEVIDARFDEKDMCWSITVRTTNPAGDAQLTTACFDYLIIANGIFSVPMVPDYPGTEAFESRGGQVLHTSQFNDKQIVDGKHVLVVGYGKSSCDVANAIADSAASTTVVARHLIWKLPKHLANVLNYKHLFLTRLSEALFRYIRLRGFERFLHGVGNPLRRAMLGSVEWVIERQLHLRRLGLHPDKPLETIARSTVSLVTDGFYDKIEAGEIGIRKNAEITRLEPGKAILDTGETLAADVVICGTGWHQVCPFLDEAIMQKVTDSEGNFRLYRSVLPIGVPRLAFNGYNSSFFSQLNCEIAVLWLADYLQGGIELPSVEAQNEYADRKLAWMEARTDGKHSKGTNIIPFSIHHIDELLDDMDVNLGVPTRVKQWFRALDPGDYAHILPGLQQKYARQTAAPVELGYEERV